MITSIANALARDGLSPVLQVPDYASTPHFPIASGVRLEVVPTRLGGTLGKVEYQLRLAGRACRSARVVVATSYRTPWLVTASRLLHRSHARALYLVQHYETESQGWGSGGGVLGRGLRAALAELGYRLPLRQVAVSSWIRDQLPRASRVEVIANGVDLETFRPRSDAVREPGPLVVGCIGRAAPIKGWDVFSRAAERLDPALWRVRVATPEGAESVRMDRPNAEVLHPAGDAELVRFYQSLDVFVFPSLLEGFGLPVLEAMACGVPVVTTDCGGTRDFVTDDNALRIPPGDDAALSRALDRLATDPGLRARLAKSGLETARGHSLEETLHRYVDWVRSELAEP